MSNSALDRAVARFDDIAEARRHVRIRRALSRLEDVEALLPKSGEILEIGCGHGLVSHFLAYAAPDRRVHGIDIDPRKIEAARRTLAGVTNVRFELGDALKLPPGPYDAAVVVDVLYLLDAAGQEAAVAAARRALKPGGVFVWKAQENHPKWKFFITKGQEWLATRLGLTAGNSLTFLPRPAAIAMLEKAGFRDIRAVEMPGRLYTDVIYVARAP